MTNDLKRTAFTTDRALEFLSEAELEAMRLKLPSGAGRCAKNQTARIRLGCT